MGAVDRDRLGQPGGFENRGQLQRLAALETPEFLMARLDKLGGPESYNHYAVGWAHAMNTRPSAEAPLSPMI